MKVVLGNLYPLLLIPVIPFFVKLRRIRETVETVSEDQKVLASSINTG